MIWLNNLYSFSLDTFLSLCGFLIFLISKEKYFDSNNSMYAILKITGLLVLQRLRGVREQDDATETGRRATPQATIVIVRNITLK